jgi:ABC-2 type transport system ATP-binding protein
MLDVKKLQRSYGDFLAVKSVSFSINKGEIVGLLGHNGAGKTTIMKMLSGYLEPSDGEINFDGISLGEDTKILQQKIGYLPENLPVYPEMSVADYLDYAAELKGLQTEAKRAEIKRVIYATDIADKILAPIATLSRGYKQRVGVAQAILGKPRLLILDEPTNGLDPTQTQHMRELIRDLAKNATVIISTHIMQEVSALCDRVLMLRSGELVVNAKLADLQRSHDLRVLTNKNSEELKILLRNLSGVKEIEFIAPADNSNSLQGRVQVKIQTDAKTDITILAALIAKTLIQSDAELYQLVIETRDLETLFREVNEKEPIKYAA